MTTITPMAGAAAHVSQFAHSEEHFGEFRDFWWNPDFLDLMARRWQLSQYRTLLDVGCGLCHWSRLLVPRMAPSAHVHALDGDPKWAAGDTRVSAAFQAMGASVAYLHGDAQRLPLDDASVDVATCQTVLMHLPDPLAALKEMHRVVRPGGLVICVEPNNLAQPAIVDSVSVSHSVDERCEAFRYALLCERGKQAAGEGTMSLGEHLPDLFRRAGFAGVDCCLSDKAAPALAPYATAEARAGLAEAVDVLGEVRAAHWQGQVEQWVACLDDPEALRFVQAYHAKRQPQRRDAVMAQVEAGAYWDSGATLSFIVWARR